jgi:hypothetical protein
MSTSSLQRAEWISHRCGALAGTYYYVYGGGHDVAPTAAFGGFPPTKGLDPEGTNPRGFDCSSWAADKLWHGGVLAEGSITNANLAPGTEELAGYGAPGVGRYVTLYVKNAGGVHHCILKITLPGQPVRWSAAAYTGTICGWQSYGDWRPEDEGYVARHPAGL